MRTLAALAILIASTSPAAAQWVWSPESGWVNRRYVGDATVGKLLERAHSAERAKLPAKAAEAYQELATKFPNATKARDALFAAAEQSYKAKRWLEADERYQRYLLRHGRDERALLIGKRRYDIGRRLVLGQTKSGSREQGARILRDLISAAPEKPTQRIDRDEVIDDAMFALGGYYLREEKWSDAERTYRQLRKIYPTSEWSAAALEQLARAQQGRSKGAAYDARKAEQARKNFEKVEKRAPEGTKRKETARQEASKLSETLATKDLETAKFYLTRGRKRAAAIYLRAVIQKYPGTQAAREAKALLAGGKQR